MRGMVMKLGSFGVAHNDAESPVQVGFCWSGGGTGPFPVGGLRAVHGQGWSGEDLRGRRCRMTYLRALGRACALAAYSLLSWFDVLVELIAFAVLCVGLVFFLGPAVEWTRGRSSTARALAARWCGVA